MAKKKKKSKLNRSLLLYIVLGAAVAGGGAFGAYRYVRSSNHAGDLQAAISAYEAKDWEAARKAFDRYTQREKGKTDAPARVQYIDVLSHLTSFDEKNMVSLLQVNEHALQIDPSFKPALESYLRYTFDFTEGRGAIRSQELAVAVRSALSRIKDHSASLLRVDPESRIGAEAAGLAEMLALGKKSDARTLDDLEAARKVIAGHLEKHKYSPRLRAFEQQIAADMLSLSAKSGVRVNVDYAEPPAGPLLQKLRGELADLTAVATGGAPVDPASAAAVAELTNNDRVELIRTAIGVRGMLMELGRTNSTPEERIAANNEIYDLGQKAADMVKPGDASFISMLTMNARMQRSRGKVAEAEAAYKKIVDAYPDDWTGRILLADLYRSAGRFKDALAVLSVNPKPSYDRIGVAGLRFVVEGPDAMVRRAEMRARNWAAVAEANREAERKLIADERSEAARALGETNPRVKLIDVAVKRYIDGDLVMTQELLRQARAEVGSSANETDDLGDDLDLEAVDVALIRGQTGTARDLLAARLKEGERNQVMMLRLVDVYVRERNFAEARNLLKPLAEVGKSDVTFQNAWIIANADQPVVTKQLLDQIPEVNAADRARKFQLAVSVNQPDVYGPLLEKVLDESGDSEPLLPIIQQALVNTRGVDSEKARVDALIASAIKKYPSVTMYAELQKVFALSTPEEIEKLTEEEIEKIPDPYAKALAKARRAAGRGNVDQAVAFLQEAIKLDPDVKRGGDAHTMLFQIYASTNQFDEASKLVDVLAKANTDRAGGRIWRARLLIQQGKSAEALALAKQVQSELPDYTAAWVTVAMAQTASGQYQDALRTVDVALSQTPQDLEALRLGINTARLTGRRADIERYIAQARQRYPRALEFELAQLDTVALFGDPETIVVRREQLAQQNPQAADFQYQAGRTYFLVARKYAFASNDKQADVWLKKAIAASQAGMEKFPSDLRFLGDYALLSTDATNKGEPGLKAFEAARAKPELAGNVDLDMKYAGYLLTLNRAADARKVFEAVAEKHPDNRAAIEAIAQTYVAEDRVDDAVKALQRLGAEDADALFAQSELLARKGRKEESLALIEKVVTLSKNAVRARARQAELLIDLNRVDEAKRIAESIVDENPREPAGRFLRALIELRGKTPDIGKAIEDLESVRDTAPNNVLARAQLAELYIRTGRPQDAGSETEAAYRDNKQDRVAILRVLAWHASNSRWQTMLNIIEDARQNPQLVNDVDIMVNETTAYDGLADGPKAIAAAKKVYDAVPRSERAGTGYLVTLAKYGSTQDVEREARKILKDNPNAWWAKPPLAMSYAKQERKQEAFATLKDAFGTPGLGQPQQRDMVLTMAQFVGPKEAISLVDRQIEESDLWALDGVDLYRRAGNLEKARQLVDRLVAKAPAWGELEMKRRIYTVCAEFYLLDTPPQPQKAVEAYGKLLEFVQLDKMALNNYADALTRLGTKEANAKALEQAEKAYNFAKAGEFKQPEDGYILDTYGWCLVLNDRTEDGIPILSDALDRANLPESCYHLAEAYLRKSDKDVAKSFAQKGLDIIDRQKQNGKPVDGELLRRLQDAMQRASQ
jgi:tetratricopeptide (TPR) repeat protein